VLANLFCIKYSNTRVVCVERGEDLSFFSGVYFPEDFPAGFCYNLSRGPPPPPPKARVFFSKVFSKGFRPLAEGPLGKIRVFALNNPE